MKESREELLFNFKPEATSSVTADITTWKVLSVEDDAGYQLALQFAIRSLQVQGRSIQLLTTQSARDAATVIAENPDISLILLDVVMENDDAGLRLIGTIREVLGNATVRIILLTGQPGLAPREGVMKRYDIDDYWCKSELTDEHLATIITSNLRTWEHINQLKRARQGLQMVIDASQTISSKRDFSSFVHSVLEEIGRIIGVDEGGIICTPRSPDTPINDAIIIAASGSFRALTGQPVSAIEPAELLDTFQQVAYKRQHLFLDGYSLFYFSSSDIDKREYLTLVKVQRPLAPAEINLLQVFSEHVSSAFANVALYNRLTELAYSDPLLGIHNRNWLLRELDNLTTHDRQSTRLAVLDIDDFTAIGITFGETFCNQLIIRLHEQLRAALTENTLIARIDRDALAILVGDDKPLDNLFFEHFLNQPLQIADGEHSISATVAVVDLQSLADLQAEQILRLAESMIETARHKKQHYTFYDTRLEHEIANRYSLLSELRSAVTQKKLYVELQPKVRLADGKLVGFEALARWQKASGQMIPPSQFIPLAETSGLIVKLDQLILQQTCQAIHTLQAAGINVPVAFNVSSFELLRPDYFSTLLHLIREADIEPHQLELEITETQAMREYTSISPYLRKLVELGMEVSIDDFGTGYSSLAHLTDLPASSLKIDRSFVSRLEPSASDEHVVEMILRLGTLFNFKIVAEGIETEFQRTKLLAMGCEIGQGYLFSPPMPLAAALRWSQGRF